MAEVVDETGSPIAPTQIPPHTEFPYPTTESNSANGNTSRPSIPRNVTEAPNSRETTFPRPVKRIGSTPAPATARRASTKAPTFTRTARVEQGFPYTFNPYSSSDSSSEEENDAAPASTPPNDGRRGNGRVASPDRKKTNKNDTQEASYSKFSLSDPNFKTKGRVSKRDGRLKISIQELTKGDYLAKALGTTLKRGLKGDKDELEDPSAVQEVDGEVPEPSTDKRVVPILNIVIMVIGSRGDIQPFLKVGKILKESHGHRVRIATHPAFKEFVEKDSDLEFFSVGGDPSELMAFMVKNPGLIPSVETVRAGEIGRRRAAMSEMFEGMWRACINTTDDETDKENLKMMGDKHPFVADAIIANPPSFAHIHIAERLNIPLHIMFTFPYTPTVQFPHPLANIKNTDTDPKYTNFMSYPLVEMMTWQGLGDLVNKFRIKTLDLEPVYSLWAPGQLYRLKVPYTYMWSPGLVKKPEDWGPEISLSGFVFLDLASSFEPPEDLKKFLDAGEPPVYIGFGSIVVDDPDQFTHLIFDAVKSAGVRALVSKGWGGIGGNDLDIPENIFLLENTPHDWLFPRVSAVVHHGGAGTTAIGLKCAKPTMIVPFFGDQPFWGAMVSSAKAGAHDCIPYKKLTKERLTEGIKQCLTDEAKENVQKIADSIAKDGDGAENAVESFHRSLPLRGERSIRCSILEDRVAVWHMKTTKLRLSSLAADILVQKRILKWSDLRLIRLVDWSDFGGPGEPATGAASAIVSSVSATVKGVGTLPVKMVRIAKRREKHAAKKLRAQRKKKSKAQPSISNEHTTEENQASKKDVSTNKDTSAGQSNKEQNKRPNGIQRQETNLTQMSADPTETFAEEVAEEASGGFRKTGGAIIKAPMDIGFAVAQGFHNAPRLYGDETVRPPIRISGWKSSLHASHDEFFLGIRDAFTGVYRHPYEGARAEGAVGFLKGMGLAAGGLVLKNISAFSGPPAYLLKGIHKEIQKSKQPTGFIRRARIMQGTRDKKELSQEEVQATEERVEHGWDIVAKVLEMERERLEGGWKGRLGLRRRRKEWKETGAAENVRTAEQALEARAKGKTLEEGLRGQKDEVRVANMPRVGVLDEKAEKEKKEAGAGGKVLENGRVVKSKAMEDDGAKATHQPGPISSHKSDQPDAGRFQGQAHLKPLEIPQDRVDSHESVRGDTTQRKRAGSETKDSAVDDAERREITA